MGGSRGGTGSPNPTPPPPPENPQKYRVSLQYWSRSPEKTQSYQASIQCWAIICTPAKRHLYDDGPLFSSTCIFDSSIPTSSI